MRRIVPRRRFGVVPRKKATVLKRRLVLKMAMFVMMRVFLGSQTMRCVCGAGAGRARRVFGAGYVWLSVWRGVRGEDGGRGSVCVVESLLS